MVLLGLLGACSSSPAREQADDPTTTRRVEPVPTAPLPLGQPTPEVLAGVAVLPGRLAIGQGGALRLTAPDGTGEEVLEEAPGVAAGQPTWSRSGTRLAWTRASAEAFEVVVRDTATGQDLVSDLPVTPAFYLQWSGDDGSIAFLRNDPAQGGLELGLVDPGTPPVRLGAAAPLFLSWAPGRPVLAAHVGLRQLFVLPSPNAAEALPEASSVLSPTGPFSAPAWIDDDTLLVASDQGLIRLDVATGDQSVVVNTGGGPVQFVLSPDRQRVAFHQPGQQGAAVSPASFVPARPAVSPTTTRPPTTFGGDDSGGGGGGDSGDEGSGGADPVPAPIGSGGLKVVELATGEVIDVTEASPLAFEWSPDSGRLAWLEPGLGEDQSMARWNFWDGVASTPSATYELSAAVRDVYLPFFEQYAQSVTGWAPDSSAFAFAGRPQGAGVDVDGIWVQLIGRPGAAPVRVADGDVVIWSPG